MRRVLTMAAAASVVFSVAAARAQTEATLSDVESAYLQVDFEATRERAELTLARGGHDPVSTARLLRLLGVAQAALGHTEAARQSFISMLAVDPNAKLEDTLSPRIRAPYLEARGFWSSQSETLLVKVSDREDAGVLQLELQDPARVVRAIRIWIRPVGATTYAERRADAAPLVSVKVPSSAREFEYAIDLLDGSNNVLKRAGSQQAPLLLGAPPKAARRQQTVAALPVKRVEPSRVLPISFGVLGVAAAGAGAYFHAQREERAREWNGQSCEQAGATRAQQCAAVDDDRRRFEALSIGLYAGAGALITAAGVIWLTSRSTEVAAQSGCGIGVSSVQCVGRF